MFELWIGLNLFTIKPEGEKRTRKFYQGQFGVIKASKGHERPMKARKGQSCKNE